MPTRPRPLAACPPAGLHCHELLERVSSVTAKPRRLPPLDTKERVAATNAKLKALPIARDIVERREGLEEYGAQVGIDAYDHPAV